MSRTAGRARLFGAANASRSVQLALVPLAGQFAGLPVTRSPALITVNVEAAAAGVEATTSDAPIRLISPANARSRRFPRAIRPSPPPPPDGLAGEATRAPP